MKNRLRYRDFLRRILLVALFLGIIFSSKAQLRKWVEKQALIVNEDAALDSITYLQDTSLSKVGLYQLTVYLSGTYLQEKLVLDVQNAFEQDLNSKGIYLEKHYNSEDYPRRLKSVLFFSQSRENLPQLIKIWSLENAAIITNFEIGNVNTHTDFFKSEPLDLQATGLNSKTNIRVDFATQGVLESTSSCLVNSDLKLPELNLFFKNELKTQKDVLSMQVLKQMLQLRDATFRERLIENGLCLGAEMLDPEINKPIVFHLKPNPAGVKNAIDTFFTELYKMHRFDYSTVEQMQLAKQLIQDRRLFTHDKFASAASEVAPYFAGGRMKDYKNLNADLDSITKVDLLKAVKQYLQNRSFHLELLSPVKNFEEMSKIIPNSTPVSKIQLLYNHSQTNLADSHLVELKQLEYTLNLSPSAKIIVTALGSKKKKAIKRAEELVAYLEGKKLGMTYDIRFKKSPKDQPSVIKFHYDFED